MTGLDAADDLPELPSDPAPERTPGVFGAGSGFIVFGVYLGLQIALGFAAGIVAGVLAGFRGKGMGGLQEALAEIMPAAAVGGLVLGAVGGWIVARWRLGGPVLAKGREVLGLVRTPLASVALATAAGGVLATLQLALAAVFPVPPDIDTPLTRMFSDPDTRWLFVVLAVFVAPPAEEFVFRGALYGGLSRSVRPLTAALIVTVIFTALHATEAVHWWPAFLLIGGLGVLTVFLRMRTGSIWPSLCAHVSYNTLITVMSYAQS